MLQKDPAQIQTILSSLKTITTKINLLQRVNLQLRSTLPSPLSDHCRIVNITDSATSSLRVAGGKTNQGHHCIIYFQTDGANWVTALRYEAEPILRRILTPLIKGPLHFIYQVRPTFGITSKPETKIVLRPPLTQETKSLLGSIASQINHSLLKASLEKLIN